MLPRSERLTSTQFDRAFAQSQSVRHPLVVLRAHFRGDDQPQTRAAFVVPKKQGKATARNRTRRRLRERYRLHRQRQAAHLAGYDLIFMSTPQTHRAAAEELDAALTDVLRRAGKRSGTGTDKVSGKAAQPKNATESELPATPAREAPPVTASLTPSETVSPSPVLPITWLALCAIRFYQRYISPGLPPSCRFEPSCSRYTYAAIERFGLWRGGYLGTMRLCRCHPWQDGGDDPVPQFFPKPTLWHQIRNLFSRHRYAPETEE
jgi:hypothetical protein